MGISIDYTPPPTGEKFMKSDAKKIGRAHV
jgi:hypothetical protein